MESAIPSTIKQTNTTKTVSKHVATQEPPSDRLDKASFFGATAGATKPHLQREEAREGDDGDSPCAPDSTDAVVPLIRGVL
ncbi:Hypothetical predicted protein [Pelobates cultripes]|uniref:Uncharacterized protein n=1 Tax=Pelobates cultripes TaxID=61616 RepID=A0AAD1RUS5_PELCU|nr:Hypothetical predicted protein [Pelobates cultripes]